MISHLEGREKALEPFGWTGRRAKWIVLACLSGSIAGRRIGSSGALLERGAHRRGHAGAAEGLPDLPPRASRFLRTCSRGGASRLTTCSSTPACPGDRRGSLPIGECTSDNGVHVHRNAIFMCVPALPYVAACLTVAARPAERRRRSGAFGRRRERPPLWVCLHRHRGGLACARPCPPSPRGVAPDHRSLREGSPAAYRNVLSTPPGRLHRSASS